MKEQASQGIKTKDEMGENKNLTGGERKNKGNNTREKQQTKQTGATNSKRIKRRRRRVNGGAERGTVRKHCRPWAGQGRLRKRLPVCYKGDTGAASARVMTTNIRVTVPPSTYFILPLLKKKREVSFYNCFASPRKTAKIPN